MSDGEQLSPLPGSGPGRDPSPVDVHDGFDAARLTQARALAGMTKKKLAEHIGVTAAAIGQYEAGSSRPRPDLLPRLATTLNVPMAFFLGGRPHGRLDASMAHFRSLRSMRVYQRSKAIAYTEQVWELAYALEKHVQLPWIDLPGFSGGEVSSGAALPADPVAAARALREQWQLGDGPVTHLVRRMEARGIIVVTPTADPDTEVVDAFSTSRLPRPIVVLTPNRADDVYRHRFSAAHELGHLVLHGDTMPGDSQQEREANVFAAEFLTPRHAILPCLPARADLGRLAGLQRIWGVSVKSLLYRCREVGLLSDSAASRAYQRLETLRYQPGFRPEPVLAYLGEQSSMLARGFELASDSGLTLPELAKELSWHLEHLRAMLGVESKRPILRLLK
jgi:Zn-dependent peptidase ImmA (M78 family)/transcriptional regulator with XRE-family HTH domain